MKHSDKTVASIFSQDCHITGDLVSTGDIQIEGRLDGKLYSNIATIGKDGIINGDIIGETVTILGTVNGTIRARQLFLGETCQINADIYHQTLAIENGARLNGIIKYEQDPLENETIEIKADISADHVSHLN